MKLRALLLILGAAALTAVPAFAQDEPENSPDVTIQFDGPNSNAQWGGAWAGLYNATIDGVVKQVVCDDYNDHVNGGDTWLADVIWAKNLTVDNIDQTMFGSAIGLQGYAQVATLVNMIFQGGMGYSLADISAVIWDLTTPGGLTLTNDAEVALLNSVAGLAGMSNAQAIAYLQRFGDLKIYVPDPGTYTGAGGPQELWGVPEGGSALLLLLLAGGACFAAMRIRPRNRIEIA